MNVKTMGVVLAVAGAAMMPRMTMGQMDPNANTGAIQAPGPQTQSGEVYRAPGTTPSTNPRAGDRQAASMRDSLGAPGQNGQQILDKQFVRTAVEESLADVKLGTLAVEKGGPQVKVLAQTMVDDHTQMAKDLGSVADTMGVMAPKKLSREQQAEYDKLNGLSGKDFDSEYVTYLAKSHWREAHNYRMEASVAVDQDLQSEVLKALGVMREHLGLIGKTANEAGIALPRPQRPNATSASAAR
jgi:putative membrane protein